MSSASFLPARRVIEITRGDTIDVAYLVRNEAGEPADLSGYEVDGVITSDAGQTTLGGTFSKLGSMVRIQASNAETEAFGRYPHFQIRVVSDDVSRAVIRGPIRVLDDLSA